MKFPKHLNVEQSEVTRVIVDYNVNKFFAYVEMKSGSLVVFLSSHDYSYISEAPEFIKYIMEWHLPVEFTTMAHQKKIEEFNKR